MYGHQTLLCRARSSALADVFVAFLVVVLVVAPELARQAAHGAPAGDGLYAKAAATSVARVEAKVPAKSPSPNILLSDGEIKGPARHIAEPEPYSLSLYPDLVRSRTPPYRAHAPGCGSRAPPAIV